MGIGLSYELMVLAIMKQSLAPLHENEAVYWRCAYAVFIFIAVSGKPNRSIYPFL
jgi:hypothetical protein